MLAELSHRPSRAEFELVELDGEGVPHEWVARSPFGRLTRRPVAAARGPEW